MSLTSMEALQPSLVPNPMSNVIDSLKRLERIGSAESETIRKILEAAASLSTAICEHFPPSLYGKSIYGGAIHNPYTVVSDRGGQRRLMRYYFQGKHTFVGEDRETALEFAKDISNGLLDVINQLIDEEHIKSEGALAVVTEATSLLPRYFCAFCKESIPSGEWRSHYSGCRRSTLQALKDSEVVIDSASAESAEVRWIIGLVTEQRLILRLKSRPGSPPCNVVVPLFDVDGTRQIEGDLHIKLAGTLAYKTTKRWTYTEADRSSS